MCSITEITNPSLGILPPYVSLNPREKIMSENVLLEEFHKYGKKGKKEFKLQTHLQCAPLEKPVPVHPLTITWSPDQLYYEIRDNVVAAHKLWVWNTCHRTIYIHCCGIWDETANLGAEWRCFPQTRFHLAPGLKGELTIQAIPKKNTPIPSAHAALQLAASHKRDNVLGFFSVPIYAKFNNFIANSVEVVDNFC